MICPDSFKGSLQSFEASQAIGSGLEKASTSFTIIEKPLADGGEGTVESIVRATGGQIIEKEVSGPLGEKVKAKMGLLPDGTCVIELAQAAGLPQVPPQKRNPRFTTTYGVGELLKEAILRKCPRIVLGIGGSATCDGGTGALQALGMRFKDAEGRELQGIGDNLPKIHSIDQSAFLKAEGIEILIACDVENPLYGPQGASYVYAPQKGASPEDVQYLDQGLKHWARLIHQETGISVDNLKGAGAAGGIGAALHAFLGARIVKGIELIAQLVGLEEAIKDADLVISGEGKFDQQTLFGKVIHGVMKYCQKFGKPLIVLAGKIEWEQLSQELPEGILAAFSIASGPISEQEAMQKASFLLEKVAFNLGRILCLGRENNEKNTF
ncbi:glycerate kinase [Thermatribacter velox]|uniref:Glycerate kinase n=1 Tax=Thermatribacter velox TaxID=3039681 RepID=A0ABZ2YEB7_9BACT